MYDLVSIVHAIVGILIALAIFFAKKYLQNIEVSVSHIPDLTLKVAEISIKMDLKHNDHESRISNLEAHSVRSTKRVP